MRTSPRESGQVAVEAALVMPLFVFFILGILQLGLIAQARVVAKYAAYRAARVGAMNNADPDAIQAAAILHLLPVLVNEKDVIMPTSSATDVVKKFVAHNTISNVLPGGQLVKTVICSPLKDDLDGGGTHSIGNAGLTARGGKGNNNEVDFDDPLNQGSPEDFTTGGDSLRRFKRTRLVVQVQLMYRMPIPFANWVMVKSYLGTKVPSVLMMPAKNSVPKSAAGQVSTVYAAEAAGQYVLPINVSYAMRMQSNFYKRKFALPTQNRCVSYGNPNG